MLSHTIANISYDIFKIKKYIIALALVVMSTIYMPWCNGHKLNCTVMFNVLKKNISMKRSQ